ncbi:hypothetical protein AR158_c014L [Paramecium bursaria Chlorella virus AR158]|uniref:hypothetical protein n=1 Tax=Paramecium bursaria Chlorella virus AR158 TaxID=380598 RepID=UPI00015AA711|nr:hypothetical protein AR158_c014L [Paramecium bursaria Chlorella virus AR158]ABU43560.1 hypothetical protein AR158_c014L [Paramecium bursaria Chlorella virus AR158]
METARRRKDRRFDASDRETSRWRFRSSKTCVSNAEERSGCITSRNIMPRKVCVSRHRRTDCYLLCMNHIDKHSNL